MLKRALIVLILSITALPVQAQNQKRFDECSLNTHPCRSPLVVSGNADGCISVYSPGLKSAYVTAIFVTKRSFGITSYLQSSHYAGPLKNALVVSKDKPLCLCRAYSGFLNEDLCHPQKLRRAKYEVALTIHPIEDLHGNRDFDETLGIGAFRLNASGQVINQP